MTTNKINFRIIKQDGTVKFAGTGSDSWFDLATAKELAEIGEKVYYYENGERMWEVL